MADFPTDEEFEGDLPLFEGENENLQEEALSLFGPDWWYVDNPVFGWRSPQAVARSGGAHIVRNSIRLVKYVGSA